MSLTASFSRSRHVAIAAGLSAVCFFPFQAGATDLGAKLDEREPAATAPTAGEFNDRWFGGIRQKLAEWNVLVAGGVMYAPKFEGSNEFEAVPVPMVSATFGRVTIDPSGVDVGLLESNGFKVSVKGGYELGGGRAESDSAHLKGLGDIDAGAVVGGLLSYELGPMEFYASVDKTIGGSESLIGVVGANVSQHYDRFILSAGASATFADDNHMRSYFGVTAAQSAKSGLPQYEASAGLKRFDLEASVTYLATEHWLIRGQAGVGFLTGDAKDSPIVQDYLQPSAMLMLGYKF